MKLPVLTITLNPALDKTVTVENFVLGGLNRIKDWRMDAGGKGINVAKVLKNFSVDVTAWGLCAGRQGNVLTDTLSSLGIPNWFVQAKGETRTNLKVYVEHTRETTELNEPGFTVDDDVLNQFLDRFRTDVRHVSLVVLGGSLPKGIPGDFYKTLIQIANEAGVRTVLDADGEPFVHGIEAVPYAIKPNIHELESFFGESFRTDEEIIDAARRLISKGIAYVAVSLGGEGSILVTETEAIRAKPAPITPLSTVGAGDSMVAALIYCMLHGMSLEEAARWSSTAGTVTALKPGTQVCTLAEVEEKLGSVNIWSIPKTTNSN
ncbi:1-phosphofructokinase [Paenibacillus sp. V4I3]|uniref:1-phosphofructokinase n=1 Tax=unclassified Paenibacillus TaxID=185978 RepID=UPI0027854B19|nr:MULTISPECIES: 1-phosphofructokinase [unclassified Paenibacillus]MDQ0871917.1 1-phosphofructokinase [Paenibacillus sp. V4I3]MDQ0892186.1 1-phosphofructokinase [Paenibacillus sp. V4I9]